MRQTIHFLWIGYWLVSNNQDTNQTLVKSLQEQGKLLMTFSIKGITSTGSSFAVRKFVDLSPVESKTRWIFYSLSGQIKSSLTLKFDKCGPKEYSNPGEWSNLWVIVSPKKRPHAGPTRLVTAKQKERLQKWKRSKWRKKVKWNSYQKKTRLQLI